MHAQSRIWIYQADKNLNKEELVQIQAQLDAFVQQWTAHQNALVAKAEIRFNRFVILMVDESRAGASGCSIDKSVHFLQNLGFEYGINFFDRMNFAYINKEEVAFAHKDDFITLYEKGIINDETIVFNNLVQTLTDLENKWKIPLKESWHKNFV